MDGIDSEGSMSWAMAQEVERNDRPAPNTSTCAHCGRRIITDLHGRWIDPEAGGDDRIWRETCDAHDTFTAEHEPEED